MANTQAQFGFQHFGYSPGGAADYQLSKYQIRSAYASAIYFGDPVIKSASTPYIQLSIGTGGGAAGTAILPATVGKWATLVSDGTNWIIMQAG